MALTPEGKVKRRLDTMLKRRKIWYFSPQSGPFGRAGIPDRLAVVKGRLVGIEVKADNNKKPTPLQVKCMADIEKAGGKCFLVYDDRTISEVEHYIIIDSKEVEW
jgi:hypothetical protein